MYTLLLSKCQRLNCIVRESNPGRPHGRRALYLKSYLHCKKSWQKTPPAWPVYLRQYSVLFTFVSTLFTFASTAFFFVSTVLNFVSTVFFFKSYVTIAPPTHQQASMYTCTIVGGGGGALPPTSPFPLNTCSYNIATRRPPHPSKTQQHTTTHKNTQKQTTTHNNSTQQHSGT